MAEVSALIVAEGGREVVAFLGAATAERLVANLVNVPGAEQHQDPVLSSQRQDGLASRRIAPDSPGS
jgi:hypothetical protein